MMGHVNKNDGTFFMLYEDFVNYYSMVDICKINDNANYLTSDADFDKKNGEMFEIVTDGKADITIGLSQPSQRWKAEEENYSRTTLVVAKYESASKGYEYKYVASDSARYFSDHYVELKSAYPGKYVVFAKCHWLNQNPQKATVSVYTTAKTSLIRTTQAKHDGFLYKTFLDHARKNPSKDHLSDNPPEWFCNTLLLNDCGYGYFVVHLDKNSKRKIGI